MIIIETCPKCGHDLVDSVICTNPPIPKKECTNYEYTTRLKQIVQETTSEFLETNRDEIIEATACKLTERLMKTKAVKDMVNSTINSLLE